MRPGILTEHGFKHKGNHYATLPWFGTEIAQKYAKRIKTKTWSTQVFVATWNATFSRSQLQGNVKSLRVVHAQWRLERNVTFPFVVFHQQTTSFPGSLLLSPSFLRCEMTPWQNKTFVKVTRSSDKNRSYEFRPQFTVLLKRLITRKKRLANCKLSDNYGVCLSFSRGWLTSPFSWPQLLWPLTSPR